MLNSIHHIAIICSNKDKALHFYHDLLGFRMIRSNYRAERNDWKIDLLTSTISSLALLLGKSTGGLIF